MSDYGAPPPEQPDRPWEPKPYQPPAGQPAYGQPGYVPPAQGQNPYGQNPYGQSPYGQSPSPYGQSYAHWISRVGAYVIDALLGSVAALPLWIGYGILVASLDTTTAADGTVTTTSSAGGGPLVLILVGVVTSLAFWIWNSCLRAGRTGYSIGKGVVGIRLVSASSGLPIGAGMAFLRQILHVVDSLPCYLGYLWPLWDAKRQTFADKILSTVVIDQPKG